MSRLYVRRGEESTKMRRKKSVLIIDGRLGAAALRSNAALIFFFRKKISFFLLFCSFLFTAALSAQALRGPRVEPRSVNVCAKLAGFSFFYDISSLSLLSFLHFSSFHLQPEDPNS